MDELNLEEITTKEPDQLTEDEKTFLNDNKDQLGDDVAKKYGIDKTPEIVEPKTRFQATKPNEGDDGDGDADPDDVKTISKVVEKRVSPLEQQLKEQRDIAEVNNFVASNPEYAKHKEQIMTYLRHPAYNNIPVENIAAIVAKNDLMKMGAQKEREAQKRANESRNNVNGASRAEAGKGTNWSTATPDQVAAKKAEILGRPN